MTLGLKFKILTRWQEI